MTEYEIQDITASNAELIIALGTLETAHIAILLSLIFGFITMAWALWWWSPA